MANLLYVTPEVLSKLRQHPAYLFWHAIMSNFPIKLLPLEERSFHPRNIDILENHIYLTVDMKFVYCRDKMFSFLYETQDLSFRLTASEGILRTLDSKQFTALIGAVGKSASTSDIELLNQDKVFHPLFDSGFFGQGSGDFSAAVAASEASNISPNKDTEAPTKPKARKKSAKTPAVPKVATPAPPRKAPPQAASADGLILGRFDKKLCDEIVSFRESSKKSYQYLADRFGLHKKDVKEICDYYKTQAAVAATSKQTLEILKTVPKEIQEEIVRIKKVSKKSYKYLADRFDLPEESVQDICNQYLKRPRRRPPS